MLHMRVYKSYLESLSRIAPSIEKGKIEHDNLVEIGCYLYRAASIISQIAENNPDNASEILKSLSRYSDLANGILEKLKKTEENPLGAELQNTIKEVERIINQIGEDLSSIAIATLKYVEFAFSSLSEEMRRSQFRVTPVPETEPINQETNESNSKEQSEDYSISTEVCTEYSQISDIPHLMEALRSPSQGSQSSYQSSGIRLLRSSASSSRNAQYVEPASNSFICPLTNVIMEDPVTIQSGVTYERKAITQYFESSDIEEVICPITRQKLESTYLSPNIALRNIIREWKDRDETAKLKGIRDALLTNSTNGKILEALNDLKKILENNREKIVKVRKVGIMPLVVRLLEIKDRSVRCAALEMMRLMSQEEKEKEQIGDTSVISLTIRMLSSSHQPIKHAALLLLIELSKSNSLSEKIGSITGGILVLIQTKYNRSIDTFASEAADQILKNMEQCPNNIKFMAENGCLEPLLNNLIEGDEEKKLKMVTYLGDIILGDDSKTYVANKTSLVLAEMLRTEDPATRLAVLKALTQISSHAASGKILVKAGIIGTMVQDMFSTKIFDEQIDSFKEALAVLTNILKSGVELENLMVNSQGNTMISGYVLFNIIYMIKSSTPGDLKMSLIQILYHMAKSSQTAAQVISAVKESEVSYTLLELLNSPRDEIAIAAIKLLYLLLPQLGHSLIERLCKTNGQPEGLVQSTSNPGQYTERQALSASFLAKVPHQNVTLNLALVRKSTIPGILQSISQILRSGARHERYANMYLEGLVGIIVRTTATLYDPQILLVAINYNFTSVLTELLIQTSSTEVQRLAAIGLEKLSAQSIYLSKPLQRRRKKFLNFFYLPECLLLEPSRETKAKLCKVHKGVCLKQNTMCLIEAKAVERLLTCLEHDDAEVAEASLSAITTLLDDKVDLKQSVKMLSEMNVIQQVFKVIRQHKNETLLQKAFWMMERFLTIGGQETISLVSQDRLFFVTVVTAFHHGDAHTKQMAEKILRYLNRMPSLGDTFTI